jgi:hypothetical protein
LSESEAHHPSLGKRLVAENLRAGERRRMPFCAKDSLQTAGNRQGRVPNCTPVGNKKPAGERGRHRSRKSETRISAIADFGRGDKRKKKALPLSLFALDSILLTKPHSQARRSEPQKQKPRHLRRG